LLLHCTQGQIDKRPDWSKEHQVRQPKDVEFEEKRKVSEEQISAGTSQSLLYRRDVAEQEKEEDQENCEEDTEGEDGEDGESDKQQEEDDDEEEEEKEEEEEDEEEDDENED